LPRCEKFQLSYRVAVNAGKHAAVNGTFEGLRVDVEANRLSVLVVGQRGVAVACQAPFRCRFWKLWLAGGQQRARTQKEDEGKSSRKKLPYGSRGYALTANSLELNYLLRI
jgi:hypothetical protein